MKKYIAYLILFLSISSQASPSQSSTILINGTFDCYQDINGKLIYRNQIKVNTESLNGIPQYSFVETYEGGTVNAYTIKATEEYYDFPNQITRYASATAQTLFIATKELAYRRSSTLTYSYEDDGVNIKAEGYIVQIDPTIAVPYNLKCTRK